jgi:biotin synthase
MDRTYYTRLADKALRLESIGDSICREILSEPQIELMPLLNAAYEVRKRFVGKNVTIHIINNGANGYCPEDCHYCAQAKSSKADIEEYPLKSDAEFLAEAKNAYDKGAHRYCMVFAGRGPSQRRTEHLAKLIKEIKSKYPIEICVSTGLIDDAKAQTLKDAGLDRLNHNLNTSQNHYPNICTTHTYEDRINTLRAARKAGIQLCSGLIIGMQESIQDIIDVAFELRDMKVESIPVNFLIPIDGIKLENSGQLTPEFCLRVLCLYRFLNPKAEIRVAAGREMHLRNMEVLALYPANSLFLDGYLNAKGSERQRTYQMIKDAGFSIESDQKLDALIEEEKGQQTQGTDHVTKALLKGLNELRPAAQ